MNSNLVDLNHLNAFIRDARGPYEQALGTLVEIPSVSMEPERKPDIERCAEQAIALLKQAGASAQRIPTKGFPVIVGKFPGNPSWPTVTIYNHMDVQPADPKEWKHHPFKFQIQGERYGGRGSTDDKGPGLAALFAARYARETGIPLNIQFVWETEEEIGSPNFEGFLKAKGKGLQTDSVVVSDTIWISKTKPAIPYGLRGLQGALLRLETGAKDVHSGLTGGIARNPIGELADLISKCYDAKSGKVKIPGFYADVKRPSNKEIESFVKSGFKMPVFKSAHELKSTRKLTPREAVQRIWSMPTFEIHGITGGYQGPGLKTIVPARAEAKITMRLVPNMKPAKALALLKKFVKKINPDVVVVPEHSADAWLGEFTGPYADAARDAFKFAFGQTPSFIREGDSIGAVLSMQQTWKCPVTMMGLSLPEHGYHAINENFDWGQASGGMRAFVKYFDTVAKIRD
jgi:acetylornithine deacetylase/succinyl-diaminopimelate desuccinylase-like protein